jgi:hypothetical protein
MQVHQLVGRQAGQIIEMPYHVARRCIAAGTAKAVTALPEKKAPMPAHKPERPILTLPKPKPVVKPEPILMRTIDGKPHLDGAWPAVTEINPALVVNAGCGQVDGDSVQISVANGAAKYTKIGERAGTWICRLVDASEVQAAAPAPIAPTPPVKRGRGRPRKNPVPA